MTTQDLETVPRILDDPAVYSEDFRVYASEVDYLYRLQPQSLFKCLQEISAKQVGLHNMAISDLNKEYKTWMISRMHLVITDYPAWRDLINAKTWPTISAGIFSQRDYLLSDPQTGKTLVKGTSSWVIVDINRMRPVRSGEFHQRIAPRPEYALFDEPAPKLPPIERSSYEKTISVRYRDIDMNDHVNNVSYMEWVLETMPEKIRRNSVPSEISVNFMSQCLYGDTLTVKTEAIEEKKEYIHTVVRHSDNAEVFRARTRWMDHPGSPYKS